MYKLIIFFIFYYLYRTVIGCDGSISREFRFRSQSTSRQESSSRLEVPKTENYLRQQSEPSDRTFTSSFEIKNNKQSNENIPQAEKEDVSNISIEGHGDETKRNGSLSSDSKSNNAMKIEQLLRKTSLPAMKTPEKTKDLMESTISLDLNGPSDTIQYKAVNKDQDSSSPQNKYVEEAVIMLEDSKNSERKKSVLDEITTIIEEENHKLNKLLKDERTENNVRDAQKENFPNIEKNEDNPRKVSYKSCLDFQLPANSFYQSSISLANDNANKSQVDNVSINGSMLDHCINRDNKKSEIKAGDLNKPKIQTSVFKPPMSSNSRHRRNYQRSKSYAGVGNGGLVSLSQCPLCGRQFEK